MTNQQSYCQPLIMSIVQSADRFDSVIKEQLENPVYWHLYSGRYVEQRWEKVLPEVKQAQIRQLQLSDNGVPSLIKEIKHIAFPNLESLSLISNNIVSLEGLCKINMPSLRSLHLSRNRISKVRELRKADWPSLTALVINDNPVDDYTSLGECRFPRLRFLILEAWNDSNVIGADFCWLLRLQTRELRYLGVKSEERVRQSKGQTALMQRYGKLPINTWWSSVDEDYE